RARTPIVRLPNAAHRQVAATTAVIGIPVSCRIAGFTKMMYAMVTNVVAPARISVRQLVLRSRNRKYSSRRCFTQSLCYYHSAVTRRELLASALAAAVARGDTNPNVSHLAAINDEIGLSLEETIAFAKQYGIQWLEMRATQIPKGRRYWETMPDAALREL